MGQRSEVTQLGLRQPPDVRVAEVQPLQVGQDGQAARGQGQAGLVLLLRVGVDAQVLHAGQTRETSYEKISL